MTENRSYDDNDYAVGQLLTQEEKDIIGEIGNISFGSASTVLSTLLNKAVTITAPQVEVANAYDTGEMTLPHVVLNINFTKGLEMENLLVLKREVALAIADLMMMGTGEVSADQELTELELSAVQEAMNQMMGFAATSMSQFFQNVVDMTPPSIKVVNLAEEIEKFSSEQISTRVVAVSFNLAIGDLVQSKLVQVIPLENAKSMVRKLTGDAPSTETERNDSIDEQQLITKDERDALGELANISIGSASTVLSTLLNETVMISIPDVKVVQVQKYEDIPIPYVFLKVDFLYGSKSENVFVFSKEVALMMVDLMMMGTGDVEPSQELGEMEISGVKEIMNQMMGHAATSLSAIFQRVIDITPPTVEVISVSEQLKKMGDSQSFVQITFQMDIGERISTRMYQFLPLSEAKKIAGYMLKMAGGIEEEEVEQPPSAAPYEFANFSEKTAEVSKDEQTGSDLLLAGVEVNLDFLFGSTRKTINDILSLQEDEIVLLNEDIDEPIGIFANGVLIAYGELVNVDGFFGIKVIKTEQ